MEVKKKSARVSLQKLLSDPEKTRPQKLALFAWLNLGITESLARGHLKPADAIRIFFNGENCRFVQDELADKNAMKIMSCGVQLPDLFDILPAEKAQRAFQRELSIMRTLCVGILEHKRLAA
jgi:hypothetical protein